MPALDAPMFEDIETTHALQQHMTDDEYMFCEQYLKSLSPSLAHPDTELLSMAPYTRETRHYDKPIVHRYLELRKRDLKKLMLNSEDVLLNILQVIDSAKVGVPVYDKHGISQGVKPDLSSALKGLEMLSKHMNLLGNDTATASLTAPVTIVNLDKDGVKEFNELYKKDYG
tara:strand:- start:2957 stop:3469 length:513 start_codon:yes stop_codon:yes gene_type:complete